MAPTAKHPTIYPVLRYRDARGAIDWLTRAFGFEPGGVHEGPNGTIAHAELHFGDGVVGLSSVSQPVADNPWSRVRQGVYVSLPDVDRHHDAARAAGAAIAMPLSDMDYGSRDYAAFDPAGHLWGFGTYQMGPDAKPTFFVNLQYPDGRAAIAWLERVFGFEKIMEAPGANGAVKHAELRLGDAVLMLSAASGADGLWGDVDQCTCAYTADPDAHHARAAAAGASIVAAAAGHAVWIARLLRAGYRRIPVDFRHVPTRGLTPRKTGPTAG